MCTVCIQVYVYCVYMYCVYTGTCVLCVYRYMCTVCTGTCVLCMDGGSVLITAVCHSSITGGGGGGGWCISI